MRLHACKLPPPPPTCLDVGQDGVRFASPGRQPLRSKRAIMLRADGMSAADRAGLLPTQPTLEAPSRYRTSPT